MSDILPFLSAGIVFGLAAGMSPGPLFALVISETLLHSKKEGIKVAISPLVTDLPIILLTLLVLSRLANSNVALGAIAFLGAAFLIYLSYESFKTNGMDLDIEKRKPQSLKRGIIINALSPHPYIFWLTIGTPTLFSAYKEGTTALVLFVASFYGLLIGSKIAIALFADRSRSILNNKTYIWTIRTLGVLLLGYAIYFIKEGLGYFEIL